MFNKIRQEELTNLHELGAGSYAIVFRAHCRGSEVAVKRCVCVFGRKKK